MKFRFQTKIQLERIMQDLDYEASEYECESEEYEFLMELIAMIEDEVAEWEGIEKARKLKTKSLKNF